MLEVSNSLLISFVKYNKLILVEMLKREGCINMMRERERGLYQYDERERERVVLI